ncbi:HEAT repeat domain-containing protein [Anthocerotibacter panamensis]|uniref:HEAT repeat domain-containing protein n=1 Tax=Anthocerotibacter panamensis TaxID=2857077 RepID=UPI001C4015F7|nr:HEAT repeat domain-containing protein [Anthocerotibacter panamensis]
MDLSILVAQVEAARDRDELRAALEQLIAARSPEVIPVLVRALRCPDPGICEVIVQGLVSYGPIAVQPLIEHLDDYDYAARHQGIRALVQLADPASFDTFVRGLLEDFAPSVRRAAAGGLARLKDPRAIPILLRVAKDPDWALRYAVVLALASFLTYPEVQEALREAQQDPERIIQLKASQLLRDAATR